MACVRRNGAAAVTASTCPLTAAEIEEGCRKAATLYPWIPPMIIWRGWEYAAYRRFELTDGGNRITLTPVTGNPPVPSATPTRLTWERVRD